MSITYGMSLLILCIFPHPDARKSITQIKTNMQAKQTITTVLSINALRAPDSEVIRFIVFFGVTSFDEFNGLLEVNKE